MTGTPQKAPYENRPFLRANWRFLCMLNYVVDPEILQPYLPAHTELDYYGTQTYVSVVGFLFENTRVLGVPFPFHTHFEEINLRFYVRRFSAGEWRRGVVFIKEIVPRALIAFVARHLYQENYVSLPTSHELLLDSLQSPTRVQYAWKDKSTWNSLSVTPTGSPRALRPDSEEEFIAEHYWGYTKRKDGVTSEYRVEHPPWRVWDVTTASLQCSVTDVYGAAFEATLSAEPHSAFLAEGSAVTVFAGTRCEAGNK